MPNEIKEEVLDAAVKFTMELISLWNTRCESDEKEGMKISKQELIKKIEEHGTESGSSEIHG